MSVLKEEGQYVATNKAMLSLFLHNPQIRGYGSLNVHSINLLFPEVGTGNSFAFKFFHV